MNLDADRKLLQTKDGSYTIEVPSAAVTFHSLHGAVQESMHVFINAGLHHLVEKLNKREIEIFEMGFGTGLNVLLTCIEAQKLALKIRYTSVELHPLEAELLEGLSYHEQISGHNIQEHFSTIHKAEWGVDTVVKSSFLLKKEKTDLLTYQFTSAPDLVYFDAFGPSTQPELWSVDVFRNIFLSLAENGILVTYSSKGDVRRAMQSAGFVVEKIPGPPGKREMVRATKPQARL